MKTKISGVVLAGLLLASMTVAASGAPKKFVNSKDLQAFEAESKMVTDNMQKGGRFGYITSTEQTRVIQLLGLIHDVISKSPTVAELNDTDELVVFNSQEEINGILGRWDSERLVCERSAKVGTHLSKTSCMTLAQKEEAREAAQRAMDAQSHGQAPPGL